MNKMISVLKTYLIILFVTFYAIPLVISDTGSAIVILLFIIPFIVFICSVTYGINQGFSILFTVIVAALFAPTVFLHYNSSALIYIPIYFIISLVGNLFGGALKTYIRNKKPHEKHR